MDRSDLKKVACFSINGWDSGKNMTFSPCWSDISEYENIDFTNAPWQNFASSSPRPTAAREGDQNVRGRPEII